MRSGSDSTTSPRSQQTEVATLAGTLQLTADPTPPSDPKPRNDREVLEYLDEHRWSTRDQFAQDTFD